MPNRCHSRDACQERIIAIFAKRVGIRYGLINKHHVMQELEGLAGFRFTDQGFGMVSVDEVTAIGPDDLAHPRFKIPKIK